MLLFHTVASLQSYLSEQKQLGKTIGFAPTMGALHQGHVSLIELAKKDNSIAVCSIFVNPTQFNDPKDLEKYPRTLIQDTAILEQANCDVLFAPSVTEIYPPNLEVSQKFDFGALTQVMEGEFRLGHFDGMAQVVKRLLDIVQPHRLYMGQKDFQQFSIVQNMLSLMQSDIQLVICPIVREKDGLAMSSRNVRLTTENRENAPLIYKTLQKLGRAIKKHPLEKVLTDAKIALQKIPNFRFEYLQVVHGNTLQPITDFNASDYVVVCVAIWAGEVRLIDNLIVKK
ncbi:MAG: hypothetical protein RLZZ292_4074 [Bacteroidota bacterium]|jgi:pantoate--beta-alanine ligase